MNINNEKGNKLPGNVVKLEITPSSTNINFTSYNNKNLDNVCNIVQYEQIKDTLVYNIPENIKNSREKRKFLRMRGLSYTGGTDNAPKNIEARKLGETCKSAQCARIQKRHCNEFTEEYRNEIFRKFWSEMDWSEKRSYVKQHVMVVEPSSRRSKSSNPRRQNTMKFFLNMNKRKLQVCKTMFLSTLDLGESFVRELVQKTLLNKNKNNSNTTATGDNEEEEDSICDEDENEEVSFSKLTEQSYNSNSPTNTIATTNENVIEDNICDEDENEDASFSKPIENNSNSPTNTIITENSEETEDSIFYEDEDENSSFAKATGELNEEPFITNLGNNSTIADSSSKLNKNFLYLSVNQRKEIGKRCKPKYCYNNKCLQIDNEQRNIIYKEFWFKMNDSDKLDYIHKNIEVIRTGPIQPNIMDTYYYFLKISKRRYPVCKKMFLSTLGLIEKNVEIICDDFKKTLLTNLNKPIESDDSDSDESKSDLNKKNEKTNDPLDVNVVYLDVDCDVHMEDENSNTDMETTENNKVIIEKHLSYSDCEMNDYDTIRDSDQSSWKNDSENDENSDDNSDDNNLNTKKFNNKKPTRSSNRILTKIVKSNDSDDELYNDYKSIRKIKTTKEAIEKNNVQLSNGIIIPPEIGITCNSTLCKNIPHYLCHELTEELRQNLFQQFWYEMSLDERKQYVKENIQKYIELKIQKYKYNLVISNQSYRVCKRMFMNTLCLHEICIQNWLNNIENYDIDIKNVTTNNKYKKKKQSNKQITHITMEKIQLLDDFLDAIPKIPPKTFCTQKENKIYFNENITGIKNLYYMYIKQTNEDNMGTPLSKKIMLKRMLIKNLTFYKGKKLRLGKIDNDINVSEIDKQYLKRCQQEKYHDKALARKSSTIVLLNIDSFNIKKSPNINCDADQYDNSTRLCCYNFTVCNILTQHTMCYWYCETDASNCNNSSFITCLLDYLNNLCKNFQQIIIYGQLNDIRFKNIDMANALLDYSIQTNKIIIQKFIPTNIKFETECDQIFKSIERKLKTFEIMLPSDYLTATIDARREPCEAKWMNFRVFKDFSSKSRKHRYYNLVSSDGKFIDNFHAILYKSNGEILYKMEFDDEWLIIPGNLKCIANEKIDWPQLYLERRKISAVKYQSLQSIKMQLPKDCHYFYDYLTIEI